MTVNGKYVTWRVFISALIAIVGIEFGAFAWMISAHAEHPHTGAAIQTETETKFGFVLRELKEIKAELIRQRGKK